MRLAAVLVAAMLAGAVHAQEGIETSPLLDEGVTDFAPAVSRQHATISPEGVVLRALDKVSGEVIDFDLDAGQTKQLGYIQVTLGECRFPTLNPSGDAFAFLQIRVAGNPAPVFSGWMIASSPALNALDHARYDVWPLRCRTSSGD